MALKPIREMQYAENIGNPVFITDLAVLSQNIVELKAAINMFGKTTAIIYGFDKTEGGYTPGIVLHNKQLYSYAAGDVIPANTYLHSVVQQTTPRILENGSTFNAYVEYTFIANSTSTGDDLITPEPLTDDYVAELRECRARYSDDNYRYDRRRSRDSRKDRRRHPYGARHSYGFGLVSTGGQ